MARRANKVEVGLVPALGLLLLTHVGFMLVVNELDNGQPRVPVVDVFANAGGIIDGEFDLELAFLRLGLDNFDLSELVELLVIALGVSF